MKGSEFHAKELRLCFEDSDSHQRFLMELRSRPLKEL